jgi:hypothetical protein
VIENCQLKRKPVRETVYQLNANDHLIFSPKPFTAQIICQNGSHYPVQLINTQKIFIPDFCSITLVNHTISSDGNIRISPPALQMTLNLNLFPSEMMDDITHADDEFNRIHRHLQIQNKTTQSQTKYLTLCCIIICYLLPQPFQPYFELFSEYLFQLFFFSVAGIATHSVAVTLVFKRSVGEIKKQKLALLFARLALKFPWSRLLRDSKMRMRFHTSPELQQSQDHSGLSHLEGLKNAILSYCLNI